MPEEPNSGLLLTFAELEFILEQKAVMATARDCLTENLAPVAGGAV